MNSPYLRQSEQAECGLACIGTLLNLNRNTVGLQYLRQKFPTSAKGMTLAHIIDVFTSLKYKVLPLGLSHSELNKLSLPCIIHWDNNHFVVLTSVSDRHIEIHDPARGLRTISFSEAKSHFSGAALEVSTTPETPTIKAPNQNRLRDLISINKNTMWAFSATLLLSFAILLFSLVMPLFVQHTIDNVIPSQDVTKLVQVGILFTAVSLFLIYSTTLRSHLTLFIGTEIGTNLFTKTFKHLLTLPLDYFKKRQPADIQTRFESIEQIRFLLSSKVVEALIDGVMSLVIFVILFIYSPTLTFIVLASTLITIAVRTYYYTKIKHSTDTVIDANALSSGHFLESVQAIQSIKLGQLEAVRNLAWLDKITHLFNKRITLTKQRISMQQGTAVAAGLDNILVVSAGAYIVMTASVDPFTIGMLTAFIAYKIQLNTRLNTLLDNVFELRMLELHVERINDVMATQAEQKVQSPISKLNCLTIKDLAFRYTNHSPWLFKKLNLTVNRGDFVLVKGKSGTGKSTLCNLILGLQIPTSGEFIANDKTLAPDQIPALRSHIAVIAQQDALLAGSIIENVSGFSDQPNLERIKQICSVCCIESLIESLPMRYHTPIGESGTTLSGGELQRIKLARALYNQPSWLLLDEATSQLDQQTESQIYTNLRALNLTIIAITHRPSSVVQATQVLELDTLQPSKNKKREFYVNIK